MKHSELAGALQSVFGREIGPALARDLVLVDLQSRTVDEAVVAGIPPQTAWAALAREMGVPEEFPHRRSR